MRSGITGSELTMLIQKMKQDNPGKPLYTEEHCGERYIGIDQTTMCPNCESIITGELLETFLKS
jgi:hypothetical protein